MDKAGKENRSGREAKDIIVVGGSAAGLYSAKRVAAGGHRVQVLESRRTLDPARRTLIVTDHFKKQISPAAQSSILNEIRRFELFTDGRSAQVALHRPDLIVERYRLIRTLAEEAEAAGAKFRYDTRFLGLAPNGRGLRVEVDEAGSARNCTRKELWARTARLAASLERRVGPRSRPCRWFKRSSSCPKTAGRIRRECGSFPTTPLISIG